MSEPENFIARWSRLKRETAKDKPAEPNAPSPPATAQDRADANDRATEPPAAGAQPTPPFDPASLPSIESITAESDIRAFLQSGVPAQLTRAALRRAWTTDPAIRDFIGIAENQWDFTDPTAMPGFGPLEATDNVQQLVAQAMGKLDEISQPMDEAAGPAEQPVRAPTAAACTPPADRASAQVSGMPVQNEGAAPEGGPVEMQHSGDIAAAQHEPASAESGPARSSRGHGSALPK